MGLFDWLKDNVVNPVYDNVVKPTYDNVVVPVYDNVIQPVIDVVAKPAYTKLYDWATSEQAKAIADTAEKVGIVISDGFVSGANAVHSGLGDDIKEKINEGWETTKEFVSKNYCQIGTSTAVTIVMSQIITSEKELEFSEKFAANVLQKATDSNIKNKLVADYCVSVAKTMVDAIYLIPGIPGSKEEVENVIAYCLYKSLISDNTNVFFLKDLFSGSLVCGITSYICDGSVPNGYDDWYSKL